MHRAERAVLPQGEVDVRGVAEADHQLRIRSHEVEVDEVGDPVCAGSSTGGDDRPHLGIGEGTVEVGKSVLVTTGAVAVPVENMRRQVDAQAPDLQDAD
jgi:hypothetical protein